MRNYEIMFIVRPTLTEEEIKKVAKNFENVLTTNGANVTNVKVNESSEDIVLSENSTTQEIPTLQEVVLNV